MAGAEVGRGRPDARTGDEFESGPRDWPGPAVDVELPGQQRAQRPAGQADLDAVGSRVAIVLDGPAQQAPADAHVGVGPGAQLVLKCGHACLERDVNDPPEQQPVRSRALARAHYTGSCGRPAQRASGVAVAAVLAIIGPLLIGDHLDDGASGAAEHRPECAYPTGTGCVNQGTAWASVRVIADDQMLWLVHSEFSGGGGCGDRNH